MSQKQILEAYLQMPTKITRMVLSVFLNLAVHISFGKERFN